MASNDLKVAYSATVVIKFNMFGNVYLLQKAFKYAQELGSKYLVMVVTDLNDYDFENFLIEKDVIHGGYALIHKMKDVQEAPTIIAEFDCNHHS